MARYFIFEEIEIKKSDRRKEIEVERTKEEREMSPVIIFFLKSNSLSNDPKFISLKVPGKFYYNLFRFKSALYSKKIIRLYGVIHL